MTEDDAALVSRTSGGDVAAFELLVRRHSEAVWRLAFGMLRDRGAAEDATQETFLKAHTGLATFRGESSFRSWILAIANRTSLDILRRRRSDVVSLERVRTDRARESDELGRIALEIAVGGLEDDERQAFLLVDALGLSREEAATVLGIPASTLKSRLYRAHEQLVAALSEQPARGRRRSR